LIDIDGEFHKSPEIKGILLKSGREYPHF